MREPIATQFFEGTEDQTIDFGDTRTHLVLHNTSSSPLTFTALSRHAPPFEIFKATLNAGDVFDERINPFGRVKIEVARHGTPGDDTFTDGRYHGYVRFLP